MSLFGGLRSVGQRQTQKRRYLTDLLERNEVVGVVEARGTEADLGQLPASHQYYGTFFPESSPGTSGSGGTRIAISQQLVSRATDVTVKVHARGRALTVTLHFEIPLSFTTVHLDPALPMAAQVQVMRTAAAHLRRTAGVQIIGGDWNFTIPGEERLSGGGEVRITRTHLAAAFEDAFGEFAQLQQPDYTYRRLGREDAETSVFSRIDRLYSNVHPTVMEAMWMTAGVVGSLAARSLPSDHRAVRVVFRRCAQSSRAIVRPKAAKHPGLLAEFKSGIGAEIEQSTAAARLQRIICAAHVAQKRTDGARRTHDHPTDEDKADVCLKAVRRIRDGNDDAAVALLRGVPELAAAD